MTILYLYIVFVAVVISFAIFRIDNVRFYRLILLGMVYPILLLCDILNLILKNAGVYIKATVMLEKEVTENDD